VLPEANDALVGSALRAQRFQEFFKQLAAAVYKDVVVFVLISIKVMFQQRPEEDAAIERLAAGVEYLASNIQAHDAVARGGICDACPLHCAREHINNLTRYADG